VRTPTAVVLWLSFLFHSVAYACDDWAAMVVSVNGHVQLKPVDVAEGDGVVSNHTNLKPDDVVCPGQQLQVGSNSRAAIYLRNNSFVRLDENTVLSFPAAYTADSQGFWIEVKQGVSHFISRLTQRFEVRTAYTNAAVDGTEFLVAADINGSKISVIEGQVSVTPVQGGAAQTLMDGQSATLVKGSPMQVMQISATNMVDWALYFPSVVLTDQLDSPEYNQQLSRASHHIKAGRADLAIQLLTSIPAPDAAIQVSLASAYLSVGNLSLAKMVVTDIHTGEALAVQSLISTLTNQPQHALELAQSAVKAGGQSLAALLALTYAYQGNLQLNAALEVAREAALAHPQEYIVWVRLSELQVATGDISGADQSIGRAIGLNNADPAVLVQSGFIGLFNHRYKQAESLFRSAIQADSENPQARLGMGLVLLRQGELESGRMQLEYAVSLDPARSVLRSYLGRAYFEEKRDDEASVQWELAKQFDPQDPTAYYYEGVRKLYSNDPVGAIEELETSRRLNDERALYRSETLLQSDAASRSAALARAYDEVGYDQGVLLAGWDAIRRDPTNSEGHRLLADKYRGNSRYEAARASELLQSQLWQPLSAYPLQPQLSETGIGFVEGAGPQQPGYNEYHSLFTQDGVYGAVNGYGGSDGTWGDDLVGSFLAGPIAVSLGQYHFESDGWRENTGQDQNVYNGFLQWDVSSAFSLQYEHRELDWEKEYVETPVPDSENAAFSENQKRELDRIGALYRISPETSVLFSAYLQQWFYDQSADADAGGRPNTGDFDAQSLEMLIAHKWNQMSLVFGFGNLQLDSYETLYTQISEDFGLILEVLDDYQEHQSGEASYGYGYLYSKPAEKLDLGFGMGFYKGDEKRAVDEFRIESLSTSTGFIISYDEYMTYSEPENEIEKWLPKFGFAYHFSDDVVIRAAVTKSISRPDAAIQSIEPTMFMGFNQAFYDFDGAWSENFGIAADLFYQSAKYGLEYQRRFITSPVESVLGTDYVDQSEAAMIAYYDTSLSKAVSLSIDLMWSKRDLGEQGFELAVDTLDQYQVPISLRLFDQSQFSVLINQTYYKQRVALPVAGRMDNKNVWITDVVWQYSSLQKSAIAKFGVRNLLDKREEYLGYASDFLAFYPGRFWYLNLSVKI